MCPRCNAELFKNSDMYGAYLQCLTCGYMYDLVIQISKREYVDEPRKKYAYSRKFKGLYNKYNSKTEAS